MVSLGPRAHSLGTGSATALYAKSRREGLREAE
jgi:hypothetical protein